LAACVPTSCSKHPVPADEPVRVAAVADLFFAFGELGAAFEKATGRRVVMQVPPARSFAGMSRRAARAKPRERILG
jgi:hypothetical protein